jgi:hypothetical protein
LEWNYRGLEMIALPVFNGLVAAIHTDDAKIVGIFTQLRDATRLGVLPQ